MAIESTHGTLVASTVASVSLNAATLGTNNGRLRVTNRSGTAAITWAYGWSNPADPSALAADHLVLPATICTDELVLPIAGRGDTLYLKLISAGTPDYSVELLPEYG